MTAEPFRAVITGLGRIASILEDDTLREKPCTHAGAITASGSGCVLAAGMDIDGEKRRLFSARWNVPVFDDAEEMIKAARPHIFCIATHPDTHEYYCVLAARYKTPLIICEKPMAASLSSAKRMCALHTRGAAKILVNHERRYSENYVQIKNFIQSGEAGRLLGVNAVLCMGKTSRFIDMLWHDGTHLADAIMFLTGDMLIHKKTYPQTTSGNKGSVYLLGMLKKSALPVLIELRAERDHIIFEIELSFEKGRARIGNGVFQIELSAPASYAHNFRSLQPVAAGFPGPTGYFSGMINDAAGCVREAGREPVSSARTALDVVKYLHSVHRWN
ncbi:MAG: Gfo/Idh/MocA family oxidoreductase [Spirochaetaceae bacterium]|nr:Gfo/Idh/MocA family oxidoreductase [Spirochaetaceae bacterium]